jgi:hypothetical protein
MAQSGAVVAREDVDEYTIKSPGGVGGWETQANLYLHIGGLEEDMMRIK